MLVKNAAGMYEYEIKNAFAFNIGAYIIQLKKIASVNKIFTDIIGCHFTIWQPCPTALEFLSLMNEHIHVCMIELYLSRSFLLMLHYVCMHESTCNAAATAMFSFISSHLSVSFGAGRLIFVRIFHNQCKSWKEKLYKYYVFLCRKYTKILKLLCQIISVVFWILHLRDFNYYRFASLSISVALFVLCWYIPKLLLLHYIRAYVCTYVHMYTAIQTILSMLRKVFCLLCDLERKYMMYVHMFVYSLPAFATWT